jgi:hypothetical protein
MSSKGDDSGGCLESANQVVKEFNHGLVHMTRNLKDNVMREANILVPHSFPFYLNVIQDRKAHGKPSCLVTV